MDAKRLNISSASPYEDIIGFSRVVRIGPFVYVSGTTSMGDDGKLIGVHDVYNQTIQVFHNIEGALAGAGAMMGDVVRTRIYVRNIEHWQKVGEAHKAVFGEIRPASTMIEVSRFVDPRMLIEIDADAYVGDDAPEA
jgi:enamine deaminase RidA (YjgF/YER057c/UK114 family)